MITFAFESKLQNFRILKSFMLTQFLLFVQLSLSASGKFIQTKHMQGGVLGWPKALLAQKYLWSSLPLPIKFYKTDIKLTKLIDPFLNDINFSVNDEIANAINGVSDSKDDENDEENSEYNIQGIFHNFLGKLQNQNIKLFDDENSNDHWYEECTNSKNIELLDKMGMASMLSQFEKVGCDDIDELIGQLCALVFVIVPIIVMWVIITLFYIFYCCGCCCCCRAKDRYGPGIVSIVFYGIIGGCLVIALIFNILSSVYIYNVINYVLNGNVFDDINYSLDYAKPSVETIAKDFQGNLTDSLNSTTHSITNNVDHIIDSLLGTIRSTLSNFTSLEGLFQNISNINESNIAPSLEAQVHFSKCYGDSFETDSDHCPRVVSEASEYLNSIDITGINSIISDLGSIESIISDINSTLDSTLELDDAKDSIIEMVNNITDSVNDFNLTEMIDDLNISSFQKQITDVKEDVKDFDPISTYYPAFKAAPFIFPFFLLILTALELMAFWLKNCCSRCIVCCCCCRCCCTSCLALFGMMCTFFAIPLLFIDTIYYQGDEIFEHAMKKVINDDLEIKFPNISIGDKANGMIDDLVIQPIQLNKPVIIKKFVDAKLDTKLTEWIAINNIVPFKQIADTLNLTIRNIQINESKITNIANDAINGAVDFTNYSDFLKDLPLGDIEGALQNVTDNNISKQIEEQCEAHINCATLYNKTIDLYNYLFNNLTEQSERAPIVMNETKDIIETIPTKISSNVKDLSHNILFNFGNSIAQVINVIEPSLSGTKVDWAISAFNIIRVKACYNLLGAAMAFSISAHLFIVGFAAMTILLCVRRKGMGKVAKEREISYSYYSYDYSYSAEKDDKKKKKSKGKSRHVDSDEENTSGVSLVEFKDDMGDDPENSERRDSDDEISNYNNPYQHDDSSTIRQNDDDDDDESTNKNESSFHPSFSERDQNSEPAFSIKEDESTNNSEVIKNLVAKMISDDEDDDETAKESETENKKVTESETNEVSESNNKSSGNDDDEDDEDDEDDDDDQQTYII